MIRRLALSAFALITAASVAGSAELRVPADYPTVWAAAMASAPDDTVLVAPGTYEHGESWPGGFAIARLFHALTIRSEAGPGVTALVLPSPPGPNAYGFHADTFPGEVVVEGFTLRSPFAPARAVSVVDVGGVRIQDCRFEGFRGLAGCGIYAENTPAVIGSSVFAGCSAPEGSGVIDSWDSEPLELADCLLEQCTHPLRWAGAIDVRDTRFERNEGTIAYLQGPGTMTRCEFRENTVIGTANELAYLSYLLVTECLFVRNVALGATNRAVYGHFSDIENCLFADNFGDPPAQSAIATNGGSFQRNVVAGNRGARAALLNSPASCNYFWDNSEENTASDLGGQGWIVDPQFCDRDASDYSVMSTSPCLPANSGSCGLVGPFAEGCESRGIVIDTDPLFLDVTVEGFLPQSTAPVYLEGAEGSTVLISIDESQIVETGKREVFDSWSDGGARVHDITVGPPGTRITASLHREHLLTMNAQLGGTVDPPTSWHLVGAPVEIRATATFPAWFTGWIGTGPGAYTGPDSVVTVFMHEPFHQLATFSSYWEVTVDSDPPGARLIADGAEFEAPHVFHWRQGSQHVVEAYVAREYAPGERLVFTGWLVGHQDPVRVVNVGWGPLGVKALHVPEYLLAMEVQGAGSVEPGSSWYAPGVAVPISAVPGTGSVFDGWVGTGAGSYTGPDANASVTMSGPITEIAEFRSAAAAVVLSLSDTDPAVAITSTPLGVGQVHLWLDCAEGSGVSWFEGRAAGSMTVLGFQPAPGIINTGGPADLALVIPGCPTGPQRLGSFTVHDASGGTLCLEAGGSGLLRAHDCSFPTPAYFTWPNNLRIRGVTTDGTTPCASGTGCGGSGGIRRPAGSQVLADDLRGARPNPVRGSTVLEFALERGGPARLDVYDVTGRLVRRLAEGPRGAGEHRVGWDRRDGQGGRVPAGVYFVRLTAGEFTGTRKVLVLD